MVAVATQDVGQQVKSQSVANDVGDTNGKPMESIVTLSILREVRDAQASHGLKQTSDYQRYRGYCTRRLRRVRKATHTTNGRARYDGRPITCEHVKSDSRTLLIPLYNAERAWAYAMDIKRSPPSGPARARRTVIARLTKAVAHAKHLRTLCVDAAADSDTCLEAEAYARWMCATLALEREGWAGALGDFEVAHKVYSGLAGVRTGTAAAAVFEEKCEEIAQAMRFCRYNVAREDGGDGSTLDADADLRGLAAAAAQDDVLAEKIEDALAAARKRAAVSFGRIEWCGRSVELRSEVVREAMLAVKEETDELNKRSDVREPDHYDKLFIAYGDANKVVQNEIKQFRQATAASAEERIEELQLIAAYLTYGRLNNTVERNKLLVQVFHAKRTAKADDFVRLYDNLVNNTSDIAALKGVADDAELAMRVEEQRKLFTAQKCLHLARCYLAAAMYDAANQLFARVPVHASALASGGGPLSKDANKVMRDAAGLRVRARAQLFLREANANADAAAHDEYDSNQRAMCDGDNLHRMLSFAKHPGSVRCIAEVPPRLQAVPCKPVLFDLALDAIAFPGDKERDAKKKEEEQAVANPPATEPMGALASTRLGRWFSGARG